MENNDLGTSSGEDQAIVNGTASVPAVPASVPSADEFYIVDVRREWSGRPYITVWRPDDAGYAYPLAWAGRYSRQRVDEASGYYYKLRYNSTRVLDRYPVPCPVVDALAVAPAPRTIGGDVGPVIPNTRGVRAALRRARYVPAQGTEARSGETSGSTEGDGPVAKPCAPGGSV